MLMLIDLLVASRSGLNVLCLENCLLIPSLVSIILSFEGDALEALLLLPRPLSCVGTSGTISSILAISILPDLTYLSSSNWK